MSGRIVWFMPQIKRFAITLHLSYAVKHIITRTTIYFFCFQKIKCLHGKLILYFLFLKESCVLFPLVFTSKSFCSIKRRSIKQNCCWQFLKSGELKWEAIIRQYSTMSGWWGFALLTLVSLRQEPLQLLWVIGRFAEW